VTGLNAGRFHQPRYAILAASKASINKVSHYAQRTIGAIAGFVAVFNCFEKLGVLTFVGTCWTAKSVVKPLLDVPSRRHIVRVDQMVRYWAMKRYFP